jgi:transcriptional regulator with XRE-family HTH domain
MARQAQNLKALRQSLGLSLADAAGQVHVAPRSWARYEAGDRAIPEGVIHLFCIQNNLDYKAGLLTKGNKSGRGLLSDKAGEE